jgi:hypothetical protein
MKRCRKTRKFAIEPMQTTFEPWSGGGAVLHGRSETWRHRGDPRATDWWRWEEAKERAARVVGTATRPKNQRGRLPPAWPIIPRDNTRAYKINSNAKRPSNSSTQINTTAQPSRRGLFSEVNHVKKWRGNLGVTRGEAFSLYARPASTFGAGISHLFSFGWERGAKFSTALFLH